MSDFDDARQSLIDAINDRRQFLALQDDEQALDAIFAPLDAVQEAVTEWTRSSIGVTTLDATTDDEVAQALKQDPGGIRRQAAKFQAYVAEMRLMVKDFARKARAGNGHENPTPGDPKKQA